MQNKILTLLAACMLMITLTPKPAEAFVKFRTNYFSSPVKGTILYDGEPVVGAQVKQTITGAGNNPSDKHETTTVTDSEGRFEFPEVKNKTYFFRPHFWSSHPGASQHIIVIDKSEKYFIWYDRKDDFEKGSSSETALTEIILTCDLAKHEGKTSPTGYYTVRSIVEKKIKQ